jgi:hypothetical protein
LTAHLPRVLRMKLEQLQEREILLECQVAELQATVQMQVRWVCASTRVHSVC